MECRGLGSCWFWLETDRTFGLRDGDTVVVPPTTTHALHPGFEFAWGALTCVTVGAVASAVTLVWGRYAMRRSQD